MSNNVYINKQKRARSKPIFTTSRIAMLIALSALLFIGFYTEYGTIGDIACDGACESLYDIGTTIAAFGLMFTGIILVAAIIGVLIALMRRRNKNHSQFTEK